MPAHAELILNEALANEPGSATSLEWVEILNWPDTGNPVSLEDFKYVDGAAIVTLDTALLVPPGGFVILARKATGSASFEEQWGDSSGVWGDHESESYPLLAVAQISLRNSSDTIRLITPSGDTSTILWMSDAGDGISIERIRPGTIDAASNFAACVTHSGSTPGLSNSLLPERGDLAIDTVVTGPSVPTPSDTIRFAIRIINVGFGESDSTDIRLSRADLPNVAIASRRVPPIVEGGEVSIVLEWPQPIPGLTELLVTLTGDTNDSNSRYPVTLLVRFDKPHLIVSEFLANPEPGGPDEWVEILNVSVHEINFLGLRIGDSLYSEPLPESGGFLSPGEYLVLCENEVAFRGFYPAFDGGLIEVPKWRALNNTGDGIRLIGPLGEVIDSLTFRTVYPGNRSSERVELSAALASHGDWTSSLAEIGATPGLPNSVRRGNPGSLTLDSIWLLPSSPSFGDTVRVHVAIANRSFGPAEGWSIVLSRDLDISAPGTHLEEVGRVGIPHVDEGGSAVLSLDWSGAAPGVHRVHTALLDEVGTTKMSSAALTTVRFVHPMVIVSEFMAAPTSTGPGEWIELYNASNIPVPLLGIRVGDSASVSALPPPPLNLEPNQFVVIVHEEERFRSFYPWFGGTILQPLSWAGLNDNGDLIRIVGAADEIVDSVAFTQLKRQNQSIERRQLLPEFADARDWGESIDASGATPGRLNSIRRYSTDLGIDSVTFSHQSYSWPTTVDGIIWVSNAGFEATAPTTVEIVEMDRPSDLRLSLSTPQLDPGTSAQIGFETPVLPPGLHELLFQLQPDENGGNNLEIRSVGVRFTSPLIIISEYMAAPQTNGPGEWIELYNTLDHAVSLDACAIGDSVAFSGIGNAEYRAINPHEFLVICESHARFRSWYPTFTGQLITATPWRELNNGGDKIRLRGALGEIIDSLTFSDLQSSNTSRERTTLSPMYSNRIDWVASVDPVGATPGNSNSVDAASAGPLQITVTPNPAFRSAGQVSRINYRLEIGESLTLKIYDRAGRTVRTFVDDVPSATGYFDWDGTDDAGNELVPGPYILLAQSEPSGAVEKSVVVIAP